MKKIYYKCDICERDSNVLEMLYGIEIGTEINYIKLHEDHKGSGKHICRACIVSLKVGYSKLLKSDNEKETTQET